VGLEVSAVRHFLPHLYFDNVNFLQHSLIFRNKREMDRSAEGCLLCQGAPWTGLVPCSNRRGAQAHYRRPGGRAPLRFRQLIER
jgi:hypothetical protein